MADPIAQSKAFTLPSPPELTAVGGQVGGIPGMPSGPTYEQQRLKLKTPTDVSTEESRLLQRQGELEREIGSAQQAEKQYLSDAQADIARQTRERAGEIEGNLDRVRQNFPYPDFHPTQENAQSLATLFSLIGVIGFAMGGQGKLSAMNSLNAMTGMMKGWQQGRSDLFTREKIEFDKNMAKTKAVLDDAYKDADRAYKELAYNREEAQALAAQSAAKLGGQVGKQILEKQGIERYFSYLEGVKKDFQKAEETATKKEKAALEQRKFEEDIRHHKKTEQIQAAKAAKEGSARATQQQFIVQRAVNSLGGVASSMEAISQLPAGTTVGILGNLSTKDGMSNYIRNFAGRRVSKPEEKAMETLFTGVTRNLASIEASGTAMGLTVLAGQLEKLRPVAGDTAYDVALKMADIRRIATENMQPLIDSGLMPKQQQQTAQLLVNRIEKAIPYTTMDVVNALPSRGKKTTGEAAAAVGEKGRLNEQEKARLRELEAKERGE